MTFAAERKTRSPFLETLERRQAEENAIVHALFSYFGKKLLGKDKDLFSRGVDEVFAHSVLMSVSTEGDSKLIEEVKDHLQTNGLQVKQELVSKVIISIVFFFNIWRWSWGSKSLISQFYHQMFSHGKDGSVKIILWPEWPSACFQCKTVNKIPVCEGTRRKRNQRGRKKPYGPSRCEL